MSFFSNLVVPALLCLVFLVTVLRRVDLLSAFAKGVEDGLRVVWEMFPSLLLLTLTVGALSSSGAVQLLCRASARQGIGHPGGGFAAGFAASSVRQRRSGRLPADSLPVWTGQLCWQGRQCADGFHRNHLLHHRPLLLRCQHQKQPLCCSCFSMR